MLLPRPFAGSPQARIAPRGQDFPREGGTPWLGLHTGVTELVWLTRLNPEDGDRLKSGAALRLRSQAGRARLDAMIVSFLR